jgi:molecular chaperone DnaK (HSP70)
MNKKLEKEAEEYRDKEHYRDNFSYDGFIAGSTSKYVEKEKLQFAIKTLKDIDGILSNKKQILEYSKKEHIGKMSESRLTAKISGVNLSKEEIRRFLQELEQKLEKL